MASGDIPPYVRGIERVHARNNADLLNQMRTSRFNLISSIRDAFTEWLVADLSAIHERGEAGRYIKPVELNLSMVNKPPIRTMSLRLLPGDNPTEPFNLLYVYLPLPDDVKNPHEYYYDKRVERPGMIYFARATRADGEEHKTAFYGVSNDEYFKYDIKTEELYRFHEQGNVMPGNILEDSQLALDALRQRFNPLLADVVDLRIESQNMNADRTYGRAAA